MQNVPQDILDDAEKLYPESLYRDSINVQKMYIHGRMDERDRYNAATLKLSDEDYQSLINHVGKYDWGYRDPISAIKNWYEDYKKSKTLDKED